MSTYMPKAGDITRTWYILDAEGQSLGRVAAKAAHILRGKHKPTYAPHADCGDHVIIINTDKAVLTGESFVRAIVLTWRTNFGTTKICFDVSMAVIAAVLSFVFTGHLNGVREGTIIAALLVGFVARVLGKKLASV